MVKARELRALSAEELKERLISLRKQLMELYLKRESKGVEKPHLFRETKRDIARVLTVLREKENEKREEKK